MKKVKQTNSKKQIYFIGTLSIIFGIYLPPIGIIIGNSGQKRAKKEGYSGALSRIGSNVGIIMTILYAAVLLWALVTFTF